MSCDDGSDLKRFLPPKRVAWELVFGAIATWDFLSG